jgi:hypothetical protein
MGSAFNKHRAESALNKYGPSESALNKRGSIEFFFKSTLIKCGPGFVFNKYKFRYVFNKHRLIIFVISDHPVLFSCF